MQDDRHGKGERVAQAHTAFDDSPGRFRNEHPGDQFSGASGVLFEQAMAQTRMAICLTDPHLPDNPIVFANRAFRNLTGYEPEDIIGNNCRFLQGPRTDPAAVDRLRTAIQKQDVVVVELLNYRKDGSTFWNALHLGPIYDDNDRLAYYFGSQWDVSDVHAARDEERNARAMARELSHRMKNLFAVIGGIVTLTGRSTGATDVADLIHDRIRALGRAHEATLDEAFLGAIRLGPAIRSVLDAYDPEGGRIGFSGEEVRSNAAVVSSLGLVLHELATNALKYGSLTTDGGTVEVSWRVVPADAGRDTVVIGWRERGGPEVTAPPDHAGTGTGIVDRLIVSGGGEIRRDWAPDGLSVEVRLPSVPTVPGEDGEAGDDGA